MTVSESKVSDLCARLKVGRSVAQELLVLSGGDVAMAEEASRESIGLDQCKARIIDKRFAKLESEPR